MSKLKFGLQHPCFTYDGQGNAIFETVNERAQYVENHGFDGFFVMDHFFQIPYVGAKDEPMLEAWTTISALTQLTSKIKLGTLVTGNIYRNPALLAKMAANVDLMSNGRLILGIGAGWFEEEAKANGIPFFNVAERCKRLEESVQIIKGMWTNPKGFTFQGNYYEVNNALCLPEPIQKPHPPIMIGGGGEKQTLRVVAKYADACNLFGGPRTIKAKLDVLKRHCNNVGRDYGEILKSTLTSVVIAENQGGLDMALAGIREPGVSDEELDEIVLYGTPNEVAAKIEQLMQAGIQYLIVNFRGGPSEKDMLKLFAEKVVPQFQ
ncbi:MAG: LLM class F420-dependent oxidoreductase [Candidatus Bathyarchaeota archaeon]|nr:LLM class F420-dependent oxidoreductase [Candidatus Bathyarchaeota archaeon]